MNQEHFARWFRVELARRGWKNNDLIREFNLRGASIASGTISKWKSGTVQISRENCARLADILQVPVLDVLRRAGHEPIETAGPLTELNQRLAQLPEPLREPAARQITQFGERLLVPLERDDGLPDRAMQEAAADYLTDRQRLFLLLAQLDTSQIADLLQRLEK